MSMSFVGADQDRCVASHFMVPEFRGMFNQRTRTDHRSTTQSPVVAEEQRLSRLESAIIRRLGAPDGSGETWHVGSRL
jgi:hypothetical protein